MQRIFDVPLKAGTRLSCLKYDIALYCQTIEEVLPVVAHTVVERVTVRGVERHRVRVLLQLPYKVLSTSVTYQVVNVREAA